MRIFLLLFLFVGAKLIKSQTTLINPNVEGGFELASSFSGNGWTVVNASTNTWQASSIASAFAGNNSAFISSDNGTSFAYDNLTTQTSHFYRTVSVPVGQPIIQLKFQCKSVGETFFDRLLVYVAPTNIVPFADDPVSSNDQLSGATLVYTHAGQQSTYNEVSVVLPASLAGTSFNLIFTWQNDNTSPGVTIPTSIDNISLVSSPIEPLNGIYTIDNSIQTSANLPTTGSNFNSFTEAINYLNIHGVSGAVTFNVSSGQIFSEGPQNITASGTAINSIVFQKNGVGANPIFIGINGIGTSDAIFKLTGSDYITFDGIDVSNNNSATNTNTEMEYGFFLTNASDIDGASNNTIKNLKITLNQNNNSTFAVYQTPAVAPTTISGANNFNQFNNVDVYSSSRGFYLNGNSAISDDGTQIINSTIGSLDEFRIGSTTLSNQIFGVQAVNQKNLLISNNSIYGIQGINNVNAIFTDKVSGTSSINNNKIQKILYSNLSLSGFSATGIRSTFISTGSNNTLRIYNNFISDVFTTYAGTFTTSRLCRGIGTQIGVSGPNNTNVFEISNNTIIIDGSQSLTCSSVCFESGSASDGTGPQVKARNNIFANNTAAQSGTARHFCYRTLSTSSIGSTGSLSNNNDFYIQNSANGFVGVGASTNYATLANWSAAYNQDVNSLDVDPIFESPGDFHILQTQLNSAASLSSLLPYITTDLDGETRTSPNSDIGADEFTPFIFDLQLVKLLSPDSIGCFTSNEPVQVVVRNRTGGDLDFTANPVNIIANISGASTQSLFFPLNTNSFNDGLPLGPFAYDTIPLGFADLSAYGNYTINVYSNWNADQNRTNDTLRNIHFNNTQPTAIPITVDFNGYNGTNLNSTFNGWNESVGATPVGTASTWDDWNDFGFNGNKNARITLNGNTTKGWIVSPKFIPNQYSILSYKAAVTQPLSASGLPGTFGADDQFYLKISTDCGATFQNLDTLTAADLTNSFTQFYYPLDGYNGQQIIIAFFASDGLLIDGDCDVHLDDINISAVPALDIALVQQNQPATSTCFTNNESLTVILKNTGPVAINFADFPAVINTTITGILSSTYSTSISTGTLLSDSAITVTLATGLNLTQAGQYYFTSTVLLGTGDVDGTNDTLRKLINSQNPTLTFPASTASICNGDSILLQPQLTINGNGGDNNLTFTSNDAPIDIPDSDPDGISSSISVSGLSGFATQLVSVTIDSLIHPFDGDLVISLMAPDSSIMILSQSNGSGGDNYISTVFSPTATNQIQFGSAPFTGTYSPQESFDSLTGPSNGTWRLLISDISGGDVGTLYKWHITFFEPNVLASYSYTPSNTLVQVDSLDYLAFPSSSQVYTLTVTDARACSTSATFSVHVNSKPSLEIGRDTIICEGTPLLLDAGPGFVSYDWTTGDTTQQTAATITNVYMVEVTDTNACTNRDTLTVIVYPNPSIELGNDTTILFGNTILLAPGFGYQSYQWSNGSAADYIEVGLPGIISVTVTDYNGCVSRDTIQISMPPFIDLSLQQINEPVQENCYASNEQFLVTVKNTGNRTFDFSVNPVSIESSVTGPIPQNFSLQINSDSLLPDSSRVYLVTSSLKLNRSGSYNISSQLIQSLPDSNSTNEISTIQINSNNPEINIPSSVPPICVGDSAHVQVTASVSGLTQPALSESGIVSITIPDNDPSGVTSQITVSNVPFNANEIVGVVIDSIIHPSSGDLILTLIAPNGSQVLLSVNNGSGANYLLTEFSASSSNAIITSNAPFTGTFAPQTSFSSFTGTANGNWTLLVKDVSDQNTSAGVIHSWKLKFPQQNYVASVLWTPSTSVSGANTLTPALYPVDTTTYYVTVTDANGCASIDSLVLNVGNCDGLNELTIQEISIYPNPTDNEINIVLNDNNYSVSLIDALGKELLFQAHLSQKTQLNLEKFEPGIYFIRLINSKKEIFIKKIILN